MENDVEIPEILPVMTLSGTVFFPNTVIPLYIFEPRYRRMLNDTLAGDRMFAIVKERCGQNDNFEPLHEYATVGVVRASQENTDGTSNLVLQGIRRVRVLEIIEENPYRLIRVEPAVSVPGDSIQGLIAAKARISSLMQTECFLKADLPDEFLDFLSVIEDPEAYLDLTIHSLCQLPEVRQELLEILNVAQRFERFTAHLEYQIEKSRLYRQMQGSLADEQIGWN